MKKVLPLLIAVMLGACGQSETPNSAALPTVEELAADAERLKALRQQCRLEREKLGDMLCNRVAEATRKRFYGDGMVPYTPPDTSPKF